MPSPLTGVIFSSLFNEMLLQPRIQLKRDFIEFLEAPRRVNEFWAHGKNILCNPLLADNNLYPEVVFVSGYELEHALLNYY